MNLLQVFEQGDAVLAVTFVILMLMSVASWYVIFWKSWNIRKEKKALQAFASKYITTLDWPKHYRMNDVQGNIKSLIQEAQKLEPFLLSYQKADRKEILSMHLVQVLDLIRVRLDKGLVLLASIGSSAPFIGLFGTVWGIFGALTRIAAEGNAGLSVVAGPMGEALIATAVGLFAAIPAVLAYNSFVRYNKLLVQDFRHICEQMVIYLSFSKSS